MQCLPPAARRRFVELYTPKLYTVLRERYGLADLRADIFAGLTVAIVALPLSMAIAIAWGVSPERGLIPSIVGGFLVSALGGSRFQIGGPAGAFIVLVAATVEQHGLDGLILATMHVRADPDGRRISAARHLHQIHSLSGDDRLYGRHRRDHLFRRDSADLFGLTLTGKEPGPLDPKTRGPVRRRADRQHAGGDHRGAVDRS